MSTWSAFRVLVVEKFSSMNFRFFSAQSAVHSALCSDIWKLGNYLYWSWHSWKEIFLFWQNLKWSGTNRVNDSALAWTHTSFFRQTRFQIKSKFIFWKKVFINYFSIPRRLAQRLKSWRWFWPFPKNHNGSTDCFVRQNLEIWKRETCYFF